MSPPATNPTRLVIVGAGGSAREALDAVEAINAVERRWDFIGFLDDVRTEDARITARGASILGRTDLLTEIDCEYAIAIADPAARERIDQLATVAGRQAASLVHPRAGIGSMNRLGAGLIALGGCWIMTNVTIGRHCQLYPNAVVGHDAVLGDYATIYPGARVSGEVTLAARVSVGSGGCILQGLTVGAGTFVGAGAVVTKDQAAGLVVVGAPAGPLDRRHG